MGGRSGDESVVKKEEPVFGKQRQHIRQAKRSPGTATGTATASKTACAREKDRILKRAELFDQKGTEMEGREGERPVGKEKYKRDSDKPERDTWGENIAGEN